jgi:hypothetical protein
MLQFNPGQLYFLGREASDRLEQAAKLGLEGGDQAFDLTVRTVQFHVDAMTRLMTQTSHVQDIAGIKKLWSELFELMRESLASSNAAQKQTVEMALKATELFYANAFEQQAKAAPSPGKKPAGKKGK